MKYHLKNNALIKPKEKSIKSNKKNINKNIYYVL